MAEKFSVIIGYRHYYIPARMMEGLTEYIENGRPTGDFLRAILSNDFMMATGRADEENIMNLPAYASYLYNHAPVGCYGNKKAYKEWIEKGGMKNDRK